MGSVDTIGDCLVVDREQPLDAAEAATFEVKLERLLVRIVVVAEQVQRGRVRAAPRPALKSLTARSVKPNFTYSSAL
jgi:hypothetical protein